VSVGIYVTSIHDIDFKQKEYTTLLVVVKNKNKGVRFDHNLEVPQAKTVIKSFSVMIQQEKDIYANETAMRDERFVEDRQLSFRQTKLRLSIEIRSMIHGL